MASGADIRPPIGDNARSKSGSTVAQKRRVTRNGSKSGGTPLDEAALERFALRYVERYATTRAKLVAYLKRKLRERGWAGERVPPVEALVARFAELRYVDDAQFAQMRAASMARRGYGARRVDLALRAAGVGEEDARPVLAAAAVQAREAGLAYARRRRLGPYADPDAAADPARRQRAFASMVRAGHPIDVVREILAIAPGDDECFQI